MPGPVTAIGERIWIRVAGQLKVDYRATVMVNRIVSDCLGLARIEPHLLPSDCVPYLMPSRYCPSDQFHSFVRSTFGGLEGGAQVVAMVLTASSTRRAATRFTSAAA